MKDLASLRYLARLFIDVWHRQTVIDTLPPRCCSGPSYHVYVPRTAYGNSR